MSKSKAKKANFKPYEAVGYSGEGFGRMSDSMRMSQAFKDLKPRQKELLRIALREGGKKVNTPMREYPDLYDANCIYLNWGILKQYDDVYTDSNIRYLHKDKEALIKHGFLEIVSDGKVNYKKSVYRLREDWKNWTKANST